MSQRFQFSIRNIVVLTGWIAVACVIVPGVASVILPPRDAGEFAPPPTPPVTWGPIRLYIAEDAPRE